MQDSQVQAFGRLLEQLLQERPRPSDKEAQQLRKQALLLQGPGPESAQDARPRKVLDFERFQDEILEPA